MNLDGFFPPLGFTSLNLFPQRKNTETGSVEAVQTIKGMHIAPLNPITQTHTHTHTHTYTQTNRPPPTHTETHTDAHTHRHTHTHDHTHTPSQLRVCTLLEQKAVPKSAAYASHAY